MASRYHLEESVKWRIIGRLEAGQSITETATCLNISRQTVSKLWKQFQNDRTVVRRPGQGRKRMTTASEDRYLALTARRNRKANARQLSSELAAATGAVASRQTIYRRLNEKAFMPESQGYVFNCLHRKRGIALIGVKNISKLD
ncbi:transposable element Tcb2 transposase [Trichonephila clavipes]|nr:transposable element Tcb2 transposase [Trichonephila clavipes]